MLCQRRADRYEMGESNRGACQILIGRGAHWHEGTTPRRAPRAVCRPGNSLSAVLRQGILADRHTPGSLATCPCKYTDRREHFRSNGSRSVIILPGSRAVDFRSHPENRASGTCFPTTDRTPPFPPSRSGCTGGATGLPPESRSRPDREVTENSTRIDRFRWHDLARRVKR